MTRQKPKARARQRAKEKAKDPMDPMCLSGGKKGKAKERRMHNKGKASGNKELYKAHDH